MTRAVEAEDARSPPYSVLSDLTSEVKF